MRRLSFDDASPPPPVAARQARQAFGALSERPYQRLWVSGLFVFFAVMSQNIARAWLAREITGTNAGLGGVLLGFGVVMLVATPFGGVAADRVSKRALILWSTLLLAVSSGVVGVATALDVIEYWMLVLASAVQAAGFAFYGPARMAFTTELLPSESVANGIVLSQMSAEAMRVAGPSAAGVVIGALAEGTSVVFLGAAGLCLVSMALAGTLPAGRPPAGRPDRSSLAEMADGVRYVRAHPELRLLVVTSLAVVVVGWPYIAFLPTVADELFGVGSSGYGLMSAISAGGAVVAGLIAARAGNAAQQATAVAWAGIVFGGAIVGLAAAPDFGMVLVVLSVAGACGLWFQTASQSLLLSIGEFEYHGRIQSLVMLGFSGFGIAALPFGVVADAIGLRTTFAVMGTFVTVVSVMFALRSRSTLLQQLRRLAPPG